MPRSRLQTFDDGWTMPEKSIQLLLLLHEGLARALFSTILTSASWLLGSAKRHSDTGATPPLHQGSDKRYAP